MLYKANIRIRVLFKIRDLRSHSVYVNIRFESDKWTAPKESGFQMKQQQKRLTH